LHRWLSSDREEAYSDWLGWIIEQLAKPKEIIALLCGDADASLLGQCAGVVEVHRERVFATDAGVRRTDIEVYFGSTKAILIEVKLIDADEVSEEQLDDQAHHGKEFERRFLLVTSGALKNGDFELILWRDICLRLRRIVPDICERNIAVAAMILAFVGAVEQNLLGLLSSDYWVRVSSITIDYLKEAVGRIEENGRA
jgi:hypothetical protein